MGWTMELRVTIEFSMKIFLLNSRYFGYELLPLLPNINLK